MTSRVLGIVGWSGSGKTTLLEYLLPQLAAQGLRVNVIKHSHHDLELEPAHKDSARLRAAGASEVLLASPYRFALIHELRGAPEPTLTEQLARLSAADLTLVEGFKREPIPKLEIHRPDLGKPALYLDDIDIVAVASDVASPLLSRQLTWLDLSLRDQILAWVINYAKNGIINNIGHGS
ncbi:MAG: molybdopterin-guanine dinucleotide biosynthesis protein B [Glaciimonas sp.]|nr:molybdopterin-guanine dinucleotide biosynthesis protein B [Glaciimonas sp.]